jgi:hypothetical protein
MRCNDAASEPAIHSSNTLLLSQSHYELRTFGRLITISVQLCLETFPNSYYCMLSGVYCSNSNSIYSLR